MCLSIAWPSSNPDRRTLDAVQPLHGILVFSIDFPARFGSFGFDFSSPVLYSKV